MLNATQIEALKTESTTDPQGYGYAVPYDRGSDSDVAYLLNQSRAVIRIDRDIVPAYEIYEAIVPGEWKALVADEKQRIQTLLSMGEVNAQGPNTRASFLATFVAGSQTRTNLAALQTRDGSRAEQLFGAGIAVTWQDVAAARRI